VTFDRPLWLLLGIALIFAFARLYRGAERRKESAALLYSNLAFMLAAARPAYWPAALALGGWIAGLAAFALALAGPHLSLNVPVKDGVVVICVDTSGSMSATDIAPTRSQASRDAARAFVDGVPDGTQVGIVSFSSGASVVEPPTADRNAVREAVDRIPDPNGATAIGDALELALQTLPKKGHRVIILLTDGINNRGADPVEAAKEAGAQHVAVHTVGIGTSGSGQLIPGTNEPAELDTDELRTIADDSGGRFALVGDAGKLKSAFGDLARSSIWEKKPVDAGLPFALAGGVIVIVTFLGGFAAGRFP
jgi:Ca-activated chloride channel family protein